MADTTLPGTGPGATLNPPTRTILALDLGTTTGWALRAHDGLITSGTVSFRPRRFDGGGMRYKDQDANTVHGTQKPVECMRRPILNNSSPGQAVYEPFMGSGTTLIAAETTGRVCLGIELNPAYVDVAVERWQRFTGRQAVLDGDGRSFDEVRAEKADAA